MKADPVIPGGDTTTDYIREVISCAALPATSRYRAMADLDVLVAALSQTERERDEWKAKAHDAFQALIRTGNNGRIAKERVLKAAEDVLAFEYPHVGGELTHPSPLGCAKWQELRSALDSYFVSRPSAEEEPSRLAEAEKEQGT